LAKVLGVDTRTEPVVALDWTRENPGGNVTRAGLAVSCQWTGMEVDGSGIRTNTSSIHGFAEA